MTLPTLLDIAQSTGSDGIAALIEEVVLAIPEISGGAARTIKGTQFKTTVRTATPTVSFRQAGVGATAVKSRYEQRLFDCYIIDTPWLCDKAVADAHEDGSAAYIAAEAKGIVLADMQLLGKQFYYGSPKAPGDTPADFSDNLGFPGLIQMYDSANMTVDATGTGSTCSSVWAITWGDEGAQWLYGNQTNPLQMTDVQTIVTTDSNNKTLTQYHQQMLAWVGLKLGSLKRVARIKNIGTAAGKTLTDGMMTDLLQSFPVGYRPDAFYMSRRSMSQWIKSRIVTSPTAEVGMVPGLISNFEGIPVIQTDSIQNTETAS